MSSAQLGREIIEASSLKNFLQSNGLTIPKLYKILSLKPMLIIYAHKLQANEHSKALLNYRYKAIQTSFLQHLRSQRLHSWWSFILLLYAVSLCNCVNTSQPSAAEDWSNFEKKNQRIFSLLKNFQSLHFNFLKLINLRWSTLFSFFFQV